MTKALITGMSGTGKTTSLVELALREHRIVDADPAHWCTDVPLPDGSGVEQLWRRVPMDALLAETGDEWLFVAGCASNQGAFYGRFDEVVLLSAPREIMLQRIASRPTNLFGKSAAQRQRIIADLEIVEPLLCATSTIEIVTTVPVAVVADAIEAVVRRAEKPR